ncbi:MAG: Eco57I restriction-modification methylase domain-containing protein, partial [bacterium]
SLINYLYSVSQASSLSKSDRQDACDTQKASSLSKSDRQDACDTQKASSLSKSDRQDACDTQNTLDTIMYFDPDAPISKKQRNLPHWQQKGTAYFVTFRLFDSIPKEVAESIKKEREQWLKSNNISDPSELKKLRRAQKIEYYRLFSKRYDDLLDNGYGCCVLAKPECKKIVEEALKHFDGDRYDLDKHVVMPNHVHTIVRPQKNWDLSQITHSWKSFTSNEINKILGRKGQLWMPESFDHIIRSPMQLEKIRHYIADNPKKSKVTQASQPEEPEYSQSQSEPLPTSHRQDACVTISKEDIETLIKSGEQVGEHEAAVRAKGRETKDYSHKLPESIRQNAARIDQALANITVCDPAIGSGAFPVGMMHEIVKTRNVLTNVIEASQPEKPHRQDACDPLDARATYQFKRQCIEKSLYGVDIDPGAVEIAKLRLWLSLVVDEEDIRRIKPLPNLDYKIVCGNSLLGVEKNLFNNQLFVELERLKPLYFDETNPTKKLEYKQQIDDLIGEIVTQPSRLKGRHRPHRQDACDAFDFEIYFSEVFHKNGGFDVVIGNPPYVRQEEIREYKSAFKSIYQCFTGMTDIYVYFYERGLNLLRENGVLTFITSNKYMRAGYGEKLRQFLTTRAAIRQLIDFGDAPVFEATAYPSIILLQKIKLNDNSIMALNWKRNTPVEEFEQEVHTGSFLIAQKELTADGWRIESPAVLRLLEKLRKAGQPLGEYVQERFYRGVLTGLNEAFVVDRGTRDRLIAEHPSSADVLKPFLRGRDVKRWRVDFSERYLIKIESSENETHPWSNREPKEAERIFAKTYQAIYSHLMQFRGKLIARDDQGKYFWELRSCKYWQEFEQPKIVIPAIDQNVNYAIDLLGFYSNDKTSICVGENVNYLAGLLNSRLLWWLIRMIAAVRQGGFYEFKPMYVSQIPIVAGIATNQIESIVDRVLTVKSDNPGADVTGLEREIDQLVYQLYGLTAEEIAIVEGQSNREA